MAVHKILKMGDPRLFRAVRPVTEFCTDTLEKLIINPVLTPLGDVEALDWEGCLSVPGLRGRVPRWTRIHYTGYDRHGNVVERDAEGFHARVVQHECDHLSGILYPMRMRDFTQFGFTEVLFPEMDPDLDD